MIHCKLTEGEKENDNMLNLTVVIADSMGTNTYLPLSVKVLTFLKVCENVMQKLLCFVCKVFGVFNNLQNPEQI